MCSLHRFFKVSFIFYQYIVSCVVWVYGCVGVGVWCGCGWVGVGGVGVLTDGCRFGFFVQVPVGHSCLVS